MPAWGELITRGGYVCLPHLKVLAWDRAFTETIAAGPSRKSAVAGAQDMCGSGLFVITLKIGNRMAAPIWHVQYM